VGVALGLGAALSWGLADYFAAVASRRIGALRVVLGFHLAALVPLTVLALAIGPISVLSPIVSGYAAVTVLLAVLFAGNRLSALQAVAVGTTIAGAMLASADLREIARAKLQRRSALGFVLALCAMALLGGFVFGVSYYRQRIGWLGPIFLARGFAAMFLLGHLLAAGGERPAASGEEPATGGAEPAHRERQLLGLLLLLALLDTGGYVCFNLGVGHAATAIVAAASAPYAIGPIAMGVSLFGERPTRAQWLGVGFVIAGVIVLGAVT
jgi:drug/metabolite transporter (DMT)-like permease